MKLRNHLPVLFAATLVLAAEPEATPPGSPATTSAPTAPKVMQLGGVNVTGSIRTRLEAWDWFQGASGDNTYPFSGSLMRVAFTQSRESWDWNAEFAVPLLLGLPANPVAPGVQGALGFGANYLTANDRHQNATMLFPKQLYARFTNFGGSKAHALKVGRYEFLDGSETASRNATLATLKNTRINQRLLGNFSFSHVGRSFDGMHYSYSKPSGTFTLLGGIPTRGVFQVDGWGWNRTAFGYASYVKPWGTATHAAETRVFSLFYDDWRSVLKTDNRPLAVRRADLANIKVGTFGGHTVHAITTGAGTVDLMLWGAAQTGRWGVQNHRAGAFDAEGGIQPARWPKLKPWLRGGFYWGSGDHNPNDARHETFFQVMPTPRPFARFPFFNMMNNRDVFGMVTLRPHAKVTISNEFHALRVSESHDLWYQGGGVFQPWTFGYAGRATSGQSSLANLYDVNLEFRARPTLTLVGYFGYAQGLATISTIYPAGRGARFGYVEALYKF